MLSIVMAATDMNQNFNSLIEEHHNNEGLNHNKYRGTGTIVPIKTEVRGI